MNSGGYKFLIMSYFKSIILSAAVIVLLLLRPALVFSETLKPVGIATVSKFYRDQYVAALFHNESTSDPETLIKSNQPKRMVMVIRARQIPARNFRMDWGQAVEINHKKNPDYRRVSLAGGGLEEFLAFPTLLPDQKLYKNDVLTIELIRSKKSGNLNTLIKLNDQYVVAKKGARLFRIFLRCWLGKNPPTEDFKHYILGTTKNPEFERLLPLFNGAKPSI